MKNSRIYIFFIVLALTFWNPLTYHFVYKDSEISHAKILNVLLCVFFVFGMVASFLISRNRINQRRRDILLLFSFIGIFYSVLVGINLLIGLKLKRSESVNKSSHGLIFDPGTRMEFKTPEFNYVANINSIGLRDTEIEIAKTKPRILCFGDSWTFGWGVSLDYSWPRQLNSMLRDKGKNVEVINCGHPGTCTTEYKANLKKIVPVLKPDIVIVGVLQLDDLAQLGETYPDQFLNNAPAQKTNYLKGVGYTFLAFLNTSFDNIKTIFTSQKKPVISQKALWVKSTSDYLRSLTPFQRLRYETFYDTVRHLFETGNLNPGLLPYYIVFPDRDFVFNDPTNAETQFAIEQMKKDFAEMKKVCTENNATLIFVNLPQNTFTGHNVECFSFVNVINDYVEHNNHIDSIYASVAKDQNLPYFELTDAFRALPEKTDYFYRYDSHPTQKGCNEIAKGICRFLIDSNYVK